MRIEQELKLDFADVLIRPKRSTLKSRSEVILERQITFKHSKQIWTGIPIVAANMDHTGTVDMALALTDHKLLTAIDKFANAQSWKNLEIKNPQALAYTFMSSGVKPEDLTKLRHLLTEVVPSVNLICLDVANGYTQNFVDAVAKIRSWFAHKTIMAGNVVTGEMAEELIISGADIVKIGIGPGSVCTTRMKTGVGYPQLSAIIECADAAHGLGGHVCADGGCTAPGDIAKAFAAGADFVMLGGMFAGHDECHGEIIEKNQKKYKRFYGMSSKEAMTKYYGNVADYRASEGKAVEIPYRGPVQNTILDILGGLRSACTYVGASRLKELSKRTTFIQVSRQLNEVFNPFSV